MITESDKSDNAPALSAAAKLAIEYISAGVPITPISGANQCPVMPYKLLRALKQKETAAWFAEERNHLLAILTGGEREAFWFRSADAHKDWLAAVGLKVPNLPTRLTNWDRDGGVFVLYRCPGFEVPAGQVLAWRHGPEKDIWGDLIPFRKVTTTGAGGFVVPPQTEMLAIQAVSEAERAAMLAAAKGLDEPPPPPPPPPPELVFAKNVALSYGCEPPRFLTAVEKTESIEWLTSLIATTAVDNHFATALELLVNRLLPRTGGGQQ